MTEWISVKDKLPDRYKSVLLYTSHLQACDIGFYDGEYKDCAYTGLTNPMFTLRHGEMRLQYVTHWAEFPEPPSP